MRYVKLAPHYRLCGWRDIPYALLNCEENWSSMAKVIPLTENQKQAIEMVLQPGVSIDDRMLPVAMRRAMNILYQRGILEDRGDKGTKIPDYQRYRLSEARCATMLTWSITSKCNLKCRHCYISCGERQGSDMSMEKCAQIIEQMIDANIYEVALSGGEPLLHSRFWQLIGMLQKKNIIVKQLFTNGVALTKDFVECLWRENVGREAVLVSFDGVGCHDWLRGVAGIEDKAIRAMRLLKEKGFYVMAVSCFHNGSINSLLETYELLKELGIDAWRASVTLDSGSWQKYSTGKIDMNKFYAAYQVLLERYRRDGCPMKLKLANVFSCHEKDWGKAFIPCAKGSGRPEHGERYLCEHVRLNPHLLDDGRLIPCLPMAASPLARLAENVFDEAWSISRILNEGTIERYMEYRYKDLFAHNNECARCIYRYTCTVCRADAMAATGSFWGNNQSVCSFFKTGQYEKILFQIGSASI